MNPFKKKVLCGLKSEKGQIPALTWEAIAAGVVIAIGVALIIFFPDEIVAFLGDMLDWVRTEMGM